MSKGNWTHVYEAYLARPGSKERCFHCDYPEDHQIHINWKARGITEERMRKEGYLMANKPYESEKEVTFESGSKRQSLDKVRYDLITPIGLRRLAQTYAEGAAKYGDRDWEKGQPFGALINHARDHINRWIELQAGIILPANDEEDHLAHAAWNIFALMHFESALDNRDLNDLKEPRTFGKNAVPVGESVDPSNRHAFTPVADGVGARCQRCNHTMIHSLHYTKQEEAYYGKDR